MNYLAHLYLGRRSDAFMVGSLLGDFVRGRVEDSGYEGEVAAGIRAHRAVDRFTDEHPAFLACKAMMAPERRRFAGVVVDVFFDHYLTQEWGRFETEETVGEFIDRAYAVLDRHVEILPPVMAEALPWMKGQDWLRSYGTVEGVALTLRRVAGRTRRAGGLAAATADFEANYEAMRGEFLGFFPELVGYVEKLRS